MVFTEFIAKYMDGKEIYELIDVLKEDCIYHTYSNYKNYTLKNKELLYCILGIIDSPFHKRECLFSEVCPDYKNMDLKFLIQSKVKDIKKGDNLEKGYNV